jgi:CheY-like chemotaxis protein/HPt (histidine-containing phosphotransfer) domain-containing protein
MIDLNDEVAADYLAECREHLANIDTDLLNMESGGADIDEELVNKVFRAVHSVKGGAGFFDLLKIQELAHQAEDVLTLIRSRELVPTPDRVGVLLRAADQLSELIQDPVSSNEADITDIVADLAELCGHPTLSSAESLIPAIELLQKGGGQLRILLAEDDSASLFLMQTFLCKYGTCHIAVNGKEAVDLFRRVMERGERFDLICMDIMMPEMDGREAVRRMRALETEFGILSSSGAKIVMTTGVEDMKEVIRCFQELCDSYLMKPIDLDELLCQMKSYHLVR